MKTLAQLKAECSALGLTIHYDRGRPSKEPYFAALRDHHWRMHHPWQWSSNPGPPGQAIRAHLGHFNIADN